MMVVHGIGHGVGLMGMLIFEVGVVGGLHRLGFAGCGGVADGVEKVFDFGVEALVGGFWGKGEDLPFWLTVDLTMVGTKI